MRQQPKNLHSPAMPYTKFSDVISCEIPKRCLEVRSCPTLLSGLQANVTFCSLSRRWERIRGGGIKRSRAAGEAGINTVLRHRNIRTESSLNKELIILSTCSVTYLYCASRSSVKRQAERSAVRS
jgi:hypothetical protein